MVTTFGIWHDKYSSKIRVHDYFSIIINMFPIIAIRKHDNPQSKIEWSTWQFALLGISISKIIPKRSHKKKQ